MATANPSIGTRRRSRRRWAILAGVLVAALIAAFWRPLTGYARVGSAYGAHVACSCRYAGGRSLADCEKDFEAGMELVSLSEDREAKSVTARFPLLASATATYREGWGCLLEPWRG
jgi:hypothetical protein